MRRLLRLAAFAVAVDAFLPPGGGARPLRALRAPLCAKKKAAKAKGAKRGVGFGGGASRTGVWEGCEALRAWIARNGGDGDGVNVGDVGGGLRGVTAARDFKRGDVLFKLPLATCVLSAGRADASPVGRAVWAASARGPRLALPPNIRVALLVLWLEASAERDAWAPYLDVLPSAAEFAADGGPMELWTPAEIAAVECGQLAREVGRRSAQLREMYEQLAPRWAAALASDDADARALGGVPVPSFDAVRLAVCQTTSRAYGFGPDELERVALDGGGAGAEGVSSMLVPGVDLCNHAHPPVHTAHWLDARGAHFVVAAEAPIKAGEQVWMTYGPLPSRLLLSQFGFVLPKPSAADFAMLRLDPLLAASADAADAAAADALWDAPNALDAASDALLRDPATGRVSRWQPTGDATRRAVDALAGANGVAPLGYAGLLRRQLDEYSTTADEDEDELRADAAPAPRRAAALRLRLLTKRVLQRELDAVAPDVGERALA